MQPHRTLAERFAAFISPEPNSGCWLWTGAVNAKDYGVISNRRGELGGDRQAHRLSYSLHRGEIPRGLKVLHRCDMPCCVNPEHLFLGTERDNTHDMLRKGRHVSRAKLTPEQVRDIRASGAAPVELAALYGVARNTISRIRTRVRRAGVI